MEDTQIIDLYFARDERAIRETDAKYGRFCLAVASNILTLPSDAEECVNDTYLHAWNAMPPERPRILKGWLGRVVRNLSLDRWRHAHAAKRYAGMDVLLSELDDCVPDHGADPVKAIEAAELSEMISRWLRTLSAADRNLFLLRYWYGFAPKELAHRYGTGAKQITKQLFTLRQKLKAQLEQEGISL